MISRFVIHIPFIFAVSVSAPYTNDQLQWIGCVGNGCATSSFYCTDHSSESITFGATSGSLRSLVGPGDFPTSFYSCASSSNPRDIMNAPDKTEDAIHLCQQVIPYRSCSFIESAYITIVGIELISSDTRRGL